MDLMDDSLADLSPLEQRRMRLRAFADRVLEAVEALPMRRTALDGEPTLRVVTACDRMLVQIYSRVTPLQQQPIPHMVRPTVYKPSAPHTPNPPKVEQAREDNVPFVYRYDDDGVDDSIAPAEDTEALSPEARATLDLEQRANEIFAEYLKAIAENPEDANTGPP